jgi:hypothetical protein
MTIFGPTTISGPTTIFGPRYNFRTMHTYRCPSCAPGEGRGGWLYRQTGGAEVWNRFRPEKAWHPHSRWWYLISGRTEDSKKHVFVAELHSQCSSVFVGKGMEMAAMLWNEIKGPKSDEVRKISDESGQLHGQHTICVAAPSFLPPTMAPPPPLGPWQS